MVFCFPSFFFVGTSEKSEEFCIRVFFFISFFVRTIEISEELCFLVCFSFYFSLTVSSSEDRVSLILFRQLKVVRNITLGFIIVFFILFFCSDNCEQWWTLYLGNTKFFSTFVPKIESSKELNTWVCFTLFLFFVPTLKISEKIMYLAVYFFSFFLFRQLRVVRKFVFG